MLLLAVVQDKILLRVSIKTNEQAKPLIYYHTPCRLPHLIWAIKGKLKSGYHGKTNHLDIWNIDQIKNSSGSYVPFKSAELVTFLQLQIFRSTLGGNGMPRASQNSVVAQKSKLVCHETNNTINNYENNNNNNCDYNNNNNNCNDDSNNCNNNDNNYNNKQNNLGIICFGILLFFSSMQPSQRKFMFFFLIMVFHLVF